MCALRAIQTIKRRQDSLSQRRPLWRCHAWLKTSPLVRQCQGQRKIASTKVHRQQKTWHVLATEGRPWARKRMGARLHRTWPPLFFAWTAEVVPWLKWQWLGLESTQWEQDNWKGLRCILEVRVTELIDGLKIRNEEKRKTKDGFKLEYLGGLWCRFLRPKSYITCQRSLTHQGHRSLIYVNLLILVFFLFKSVKWGY